MNNRLKSDQPEMTSACKILQEMLRHPAIKQSHLVGGVPGMSSGGHIVFNPPGSIDTYDEDTNALIRAKFACDQGMVVSPLSNSRMFYTTSENFKSESEEAQRMAEEKAARAEKGWFARFRK